MKPLLLSILVLTLTTPLAAQSHRVELARGGRALVPIVVASKDPVARFAGEELARYLGRVTGGTFEVVAQQGKPAIVIAVGESRTNDAYTIRYDDGSIRLVGASPRAALYAAYDLLERVGVRWTSPALAYAGADSGRFIPRLPTLAVTVADSAWTSPRFRYRKLDVEEGLSHDEASLRRIIEWMPTARYNVLQVPMDYAGAGRVRWDAWREALVPELKKRGIIVEVGGHGYENFLHAGMENGTLFEKHPEWFGRDSTCRPSRAKHLVFDTEDSAAVAYLTRNVVAYLKARPEIGIFDFWPPDGARWAECADWAKRGSVEDRQARLVNHVRAEVAKVRPDVVFEIIAYAHAKEAPTTVRLHPSILVDFCPIAQNFDVQIFDSTGSANRQYVAALRGWQQRFSGTVGIYSYYRKYAWRSLPVVIPRYMQRDLRWYVAHGATASMSTYAEPADWATYEANHYVLGRLAWQPELDVEALLTEYTRARYGGGAPAALVALTTLEETVRVYGSIPGTRAKRGADVAAARERLQHVAARVMEVRRVIRDRIAAPALARLSLMLEFAGRDLEIVEAKAAGRPVDSLVTSLAAFLTANGSEGVFLTRAGDEARYRRHYARDEPASAPADTGGYRGRFNNHDQSHADLCVRLRAESVPLRHADGTPSGYALTAPMLVPQPGNGVWCPQPGMARLDAREIVRDAAGRPMLFHRGGWGFVGNDPASAVHFGHVLVADLDTVGLRYHRPPAGREVPFDERWASASLEPWIDQGQRDGNGSACEGRAVTPERVVVRSIPNDMRYLNSARTNAIPYAIYGNPSEDLGPAADRARGIRYTMLTWSWINVRGGGVARALVRDGAAFHRCRDVPPIRLASVGDAASRRPTGWVEAVYGAIQDGRGAWLHGWLVAAHQHGDAPVESHLR